MHEAHAVRRLEHKRKHKRKQKHEHKRKLMRARCIEKSPLRMAASQNYHHPRERLIAYKD